MYSPLTLLLSSLALATAATFSPSTATIYAWPLSAQSPTPLAQVSITSPIEANLDSYTQPEINTDDIIRIGLYDPSSKQWSGVATSASTLDTSLTKKLILHLDEQGKVWNVGISASKSAQQPAKSKKNEAKQQGEQVIIDLRPMKAGPAPILNKPVVLNPDGKVPQGPEKDERSFFQK